jgi:hypothetical protein
VDEVHERSSAKQPVTIRLDVDAKEKLEKVAEDESRTVSSLIDLAVREFLDRRCQIIAPSSPSGSLRIRHAPLPDTCVLHAFQTCAPELFKQALTDLNLPNLEFVGDRPEWRRLPSDLFSGVSDLIESVNWFPIYWHAKRNGSASLRLDWVGPFLQIFVGHCVFVRKDLFSNYLGPEDLKDFEEFRDKAQTGRDLSLRSLVAWTRQSGDQMKRRGKALGAMWADAVVGCQLGTDYHIAVRRVAPILAKIVDGDQEGDVQDPAISGIDVLERGFQELRGGTVTAFTGNLLHSARLLAEPKPIALLLAGPADLRVPSLNTLAGRKGIFSTEPVGSAAQTRSVGAKVLAFWGKAVGWFRDQVVNAETDVTAITMLSSLFPEFKTEGLGNQQDSGQRVQLKPIPVLRSLMQAWVRWFSNPEEAHAFLGDGGFSGSVAGSVRAEDLVKHYEQLCELLNPSTPMNAPDHDNPVERALWKFPVLAAHSTKLEVSGSLAKLQTARGGKVARVAKKSGPRAINREGDL